MGHTMFLLPDSNHEIKIYLIPGCPKELAHAKVIQQIWRQKYVFPTLAYIEVARDLRDSGRAYKLLDLVTKENPYLWFRNFNPNFWLWLSKKDNLPYQVVLHGPGRGEIIRKFNCDWR